MEEKSRICRKCNRKLSYDSINNAYECLSCNFLALPENERFDPNIHKIKNTLSRDIEIERFHESLRNSARSVFFTKIFLIINILIFFAVAWASEDLSTANVEVLRYLGGNIGDKVFSGEEWRIVSSIFMHGGFFHLFMNMLALCVIGGIAERLLGNFSYILLYLFSGVIGALFSLYSHAGIVVGVGASGAIAGLFGVLVMFALQKKIPKFIAKNILVNAVFIIAVNAMIGLSVPQVDNSAHLGGFLTGFLMTFFISQDIRNVNKLKRNCSAILVSLIACTGILFSWNTVKETNQANEFPILGLNSAIEHFNEIETRNMASIKKLIFRFQREEVSKQDALIILKKNHVDVIADASGILDNAVNEFAEEKIKLYTEVYFNYYRQYFKQIENYFKTGDERFLSKAFYVDSVKNKMRPSDFK